MQEDYEILIQGKTVWNNWMETNWKNLPTIEVQTDKPLIHHKVSPFSFSRADLSKIDLTEFKSFYGYNFYKVNFSNTNLKGIKFKNCYFRKANFRNANLQDVKFENCTCEMTYFIQSNLMRSFFVHTNLSGAKFGNANLYKSNFIDSQLLGCSLMWANIIETKFKDSNLSNSRIYGASIWNTTFENTKQSNIIITKQDEVCISVDNLEIAQFLYLITSNKKIKSIIETLSSKIVLLLGRFTSARKEILDKLKIELSKQQYIPIIFDFQKPINKDFIESVLIIAQLSKFIIADFSDPKIILEEVPAIVRNTSTVVLPILKIGEQEPETLNNLRVNHLSISKTFFYDDLNDLLIKNIIETGNDKVNELNARKQF